MVHIIALVVLALVTVGWGWMAREHYVQKEYRDMNYCILWGLVAVMFFVLELLFPIGTF